MFGPFRSNKTGDLRMVLPAELRPKMERLRNMSESIDHAEVVRRAMAVYDLILTAYVGGDEIVIRDETGEETRVKM